MTLDWGVVYIVVMALWLFGLGFIEGRKSGEAKMLREWTRALEADRARNTRNAQSAAQEEK